MTMTTKQLAKQLGISPFKLRRILRNFKRYNDKRYTRYNLTKQDAQQVKNNVVSISTGAKKPVKKAA